MLHLKPLDLVQLHRTDASLFWEELSHLVERYYILRLFEVFLLQTFDFLYVCVLFV